MSLFCTISSYLLEALFKLKLLQAGLHFFSPYFSKMKSGGLTFSMCLK